MPIQQNRHAATPGMTHPAFHLFSCAMNPSLRLAALLVVAATTLAGCAATPSAPVTPARIDALLPTDVILLGEQHDAADHQRIHRAVVERLAAQGQLAAVVLEMAEQDTTTAGLPRDAGEAAVQTALRWRTDGWPWPAYGPVVMAAVQAGVPVLGANLPRNALRDAMKNEAMDAALTPASWKKQQENIRTGHCDLLPETQMVPMARAQVARDVAMARTAAGAARPGQVVVVLAGSGHVQRGLGIPQHLPPALRSQAVRLLAGAGDEAAASGFDAVWTTPPLPPKDYCAEMREAFKARAPTAR